MKEITSVLHISTTDKDGGSGRSANRIHAGLRESGVKSKILVGKRTSDDSDVGLISSGAIKYLDNIFRGILNTISLPDILLPSSFYLLRHPWFREASVLQLYNIHFNYFGLSALPVLSRFRPIVWRLSDMWPMTGHCGYSYECEKWKNGCGACPILEEYPPLKRDTTMLLWRLKRWATNRIKEMVIVAPSIWIKRKAEESPILGKSPVYHIASGVDLEIFREQSKGEAKESLGLDRNEKVVLFASQDFDEDKRKGGVYLKKALSMLDNSIRKEIVLLITGEDKKGDRDALPFKSLKVGYVTSDEYMARVYTSADVMVLPTLAENMPNTILESMACGTPVVAFDVGGVSEIVRHMDTGYLAKYKDVKDMSAGIKNLITNPSIQQVMGKKCREVIKHSFSRKIEVEAYIRLYHELAEAGAREK